MRSGIRPRAASRSEPRALRLHARGPQRSRQFTQSRIEGLGGDLRRVCVCVCALSGRHTRLQRRCEARMTNGWRPGFCAAGKRSGARLLARRSTQSAHLWMEPRRLCFAVLFGWCARADASTSLGHARFAIPRTWKLHKRMMHPRGIASMRLFERAAREWGKREALRAAATQDAALHVFEAVWHSARGDPRALMDAASEGSAVPPRYPRDLRLGVVSDIVVHLLCAARHRLAVLALKRACATFALEGGESASEGALIATCLPDKKTECICVCRRCPRAHLVRYVSSRPGVVGATPTVC